jgi:hypothetical protein
LVEDKRTDQEAALAAGEALLKQGCVGHNYFWFRRYAIERALLFKDWNEVDRQADALLLRMADEPLAYASHVAERGHHLADADADEATRPTKRSLDFSLPPLPKLTCASMHSAARYGGSSYLAPPWPAHSEVRGSHAKPSPARAIKSSAAARWEVKIVSSEKARSFVLHGRRSQVPTHLAMIMLFEPKRRKEIAHL